MSAADIGMHADHRKHIESRHTYRPATHVQKKKKARQSDELCFLVASSKQHLQT